MTTWPVVALAGVYPRVCGGTAVQGDYEGANGGLSPRVRGNPRPARCPPTAPRSIPACAGEPSVILIIGFAITVYPRVCGGTLWRTPTRNTRRGLSPRVRGNPTMTIAGQEVVRSIPACAGEPGWPTAPESDSRVYPRVCGGTAQLKIGQVRILGLSPRVRGNPALRLPDTPAAGSIPACAGEPPGQPPAGTGIKVYPRVCGGTRRVLICSTSR